MELTINTDGGARGNPGPAAVGVVFQAEGLVETHERYIGETTNNVAEYTAVLDALTNLPAGEWSKLSFRLDSQLVAFQIMGKYKVKEPNLQQLCQQVRMKLHELALPYSFEYVPRAQNAAADKLVNHALDTHV